MPYFLNEKDAENWWHLQLAYLCEQMAKKTGIPSYFSYPNLPHLHLSNNESGKTGLWFWKVN